MFSQLPAVCTHCRMIAGIGVEPTRHASWHKPGCPRFRVPFPGEKVKKAQTFEELSAELAAQAPEAVVEQPPQQPDQPALEEPPKDIIEPPPPVPEEPPKDIIEPPPPVPEEPPQPAPEEPPKDGIEPPPPVPEEQTV